MGPILPPPVSLAESITITSLTFAAFTKPASLLFARNKLLSDGYSEVMTYVFRDKGEKEVLASVSGKDFLRANITDGLKESIKLNILNAPILEMAEIKVFEIGTVFKKDKEKMMVAYGDKKNIKEVSLDEFFNENTNEEEKGITFDKFNSLLAQSLDNQKIVKPFRPWSIYPFIVRDIAVWLPNEVESNQVYKVIKDNAGDLLIKEPHLFDKFTTMARVGTNNETSRK